MANIFDHVARMGKRRRRRKGGLPPEWNQYRPRNGGARAASGSVTWGEMRLVLLAGALSGLVYSSWPPLHVPVGDGAESFPRERQVSFGLCDSGWRPNCVIDGDTFRLNGDKIRVADIDAPETHPPRCAFEAELGDKATHRMRELLGAGSFELQSVGPDEDRYGRKLRVVTRGGRSLGDVMVAEGLARTWTGRREPWC